MLSDILVEAEKFPAGVPRDEDKQCHQQCEVGWMMDASVKTNR